MEESSEESLAFSVRVFTLQEEARPEETRMETHEEEEQIHSEVIREQHVHVFRQKAEQELTVFLTKGLESQQLTVQDANRASVFQFTVCEEMDCCQVGGQSFLVSINNLSLLLQFKTATDMKNFQRLLKRGDEDSRISCREGDQRGDEDADRDQTVSRRRLTVSETRTGSAPTQCYQFHSCLSLQQSLLQDYLRTATYQRAILDNDADFRDKVVLDVCCGSGILSFFAAQAGASKVYAVDSSPMAKYTKILVQSNHLSERVMVLEGEVQQINCPDMVDVIVSEPMGYMLLNERLMGNFLYARKWLKPNGLMFPSYGDIHLAPFTDEQLYFEHYTQASFWSHTHTSMLRHKSMHEDTNTLAPFLFLFLSLSHTCVFSVFDLSQACFLLGVKRSASVLTHTQQKGFDLHALLSAGRFGWGGFSLLIKVNIFNFLYPNTVFPHKFLPQTSFGPRLVI